MAEYSSYEALFAALQQSINETMVDEVATSAKETMQAEIQDVVYGVYTPKVYERRYDNGGLIDEENYHSELVADGTVAITNDTPINDVYGGTEPPSLAEQIITGQGYNYQGYGSGAYLQPRDFISATEEALIQTGAHVEALKTGLTKRGFEVK